MTMGSCRVQKRCETSSTGASYWYLHKIGKVLWILHLIWDSELQIRLGGGVIRIIQR